MSPKKLISVCVPVFNEAKNLPIAIAAVEELFKGSLSRYEYEIIVTDNASTDDTWEEINRQSQRNRRVRGYRFSRNFGYQNSIFAGLSLAKGDAVVELDADLEDPPEVIIEFVNKWEQGFDVAYGVRRSRESPLMMRVLFRMFYFILNRLSELSIPENSGDFRLLDRKVVDVLKNLPERNLYLRGLVSFIGFRQVAVVYDRNPRLSGPSKFRFLHYVVLAIDALTSFSKTPLRAIGVLGIVLFLASVVLGLRYLVGWLNGDIGVPGFTTLVTLTLFLHSITFVFLGVLGEYLSRIFDYAKFRPRVIVEATTEPQLENRIF